MKEELIAAVKDERANKYFLHQKIIQHRPKKWREYGDCYEEMKHDKV